MTGFIENETLAESPAEALPAEKKPLPITLGSIGLLCLTQIAFAAYVLEQLGAREASPSEISAATDSPAPQTTIAEERFQPIERELHSLDTAIINLTKKVNNISEQSSSDELEEEMKAIKESVQDVQTMLSEKNIAQLLDAREEIKRMHRQITHEGRTQWQIIKLFTLAEALEKAIRSGQPFDPLLDTFEASGTKEINAKLWAGNLAPYAKSGAPTEEDIATMTKSAIENYLQTSSLEEGDFFQQLLNNISSLITIRKVGSEHSGNDDESIIARIESNIISGDMETAQREILALSDAARPAFADLNDVIDIYLTIHETLAEMQGEIESHLRQQEQEQ